MEGVSVGRLRMDCVIPRNHPNALAVRTRIDDASERLAAALGELLAPLEKLGDEVILIRKLELTFDLDTSLPPADLARDLSNSPELSPGLRTDPRFERLTH